MERENALIIALAILVIITACVAVYVTGNGIKFEGESKMSNFTPNKTVENTTNVSSSSTQSNTATSSSSSSSSGSSQSSGGGSYTPDSGGYTPVDPTPSPDEGGGDDSGGDVTPDGGGEQPTSSG